MIQAPTVVLKENLTLIFTQGLNIDLLTIFVDNTTETRSVRVIELKGVHFVQFFAGRRYFIRLYMANPQAFDLFPFLDRLYDPLLNII